MYGDSIFLLIFEKELTFIRGELDVFRLLRRYDNRIPRIVPCKSKMQFEHTMGTEIQEVLGTGEGSGYPCIWRSSRHRWATVKTVSRII